jgi:uncharacterized protein
VAEGEPRRATESALATEGPGLASLIVGLAGAAAAFASTFNGPRERFWSRMTWTGIGLGSWALVRSRASRRLGLRWWHIPLGLISANVLYLTFRVGDAFARRFVPGGDDQIREIYTLRALRPRGEIAARLALVIGPAEEIFWRGLVQTVLMARFGRWRGAALASLAYGGVHVVTGNFTLMGAAGVAGAHWCALYAAGAPLGALVVSHASWDIWIFLVQPTGEIEAIDGTGRVVRLPGPGMNATEPGSGVL